MYGLGSLLAVISLPVSLLMASRGDNGWQERAARDMARDIEEMDKRGYRVVSAEDHATPAFGIYWHKVIYERDE
jgi:hypothetical protein